MESSRVHPEDLLYDLRTTASLNPDLEHIARMKALEVEVRRRERQSVHLWHIRSHSTWVKIGDAPNQYLFKLVTAKRIGESIKILALPDGRIIEDENDIMYGVYAHCKNLYKKDPTVSQFIGIRNEVLKLIFKKSSVVDNRKLHAIPSGKEIERIVLGFPKEKLPGGDGVTYDFL